MTERPFERHYGELRCRRYLFDAPQELDPTPRPEGLPPARSVAPPARRGEERPERPQ